MILRSSEVRRARPLLGTFVEVGVEGVSAEAAHRAIDGAFAAIEVVQRRMSFHDATSVLSLLNREAARRAVAVDLWTFTILRAAARLHRISGGAFDVTVAPRLQELGFLPGKCSTTGPNTHSASFADVELLPGRRVRFRRPDVRLDLGGIAKGFAVDRAVATLRRAGMPHGLVNAGGDLRVFGNEQIVAIRHPDDPRAVLHTLRVTDTAIATSAHYFASEWQPGQTLGAIIDPHTGQQCAQVRSATVRASSAMLADALTKVVMLCAEAALPVLNHFRADAIFVSAGGEQKCSPRWHAALEFPS